MPVKVADLIQENAARWVKMKLDPARIAQFDAVARRLCLPAAKDRYVSISTDTHVPWWVVAVIHEREAAQQFDKQLGQGDPLNEVSKHDPKGRGPFCGLNPFYAAAVDALTNCGPYAAKWVDWSVGGTLTLLEEYNGLGYAERSVPSAYVWSGSDQYVTGKYVADHVYRENVRDVQLGCAPLIARMMLIDASVRFHDAATAPPPAPPPLPAPPSIAVAPHPHVDPAAVAPKPLWLRLVLELFKPVGG